MLILKNDLIEVINSEFTENEQGVNMIKKLNTDENRIPDAIRLSELDFPNPFYEGLQYNAPARGVWNIVHTGMLIPESHQVYVCAQGCLRGVILTAAEMNDMQRMSWVALRESDMWNGEMERRVIEGTAHIIEKLKERIESGEDESLKLPKCVLIYLSCMHMFEGCDFNIITDELSEMYPDIDFVECFMIPTMRKTMSPDGMMKISLYKAVKKQEKDENLVALVGSNLPFDKESDVCELIKMAGRNIWDIADCESYEDYLKLGSAPLMISYLSVADASCKQMARRFENEWERMLLRFDEEKLEADLLRLGEKLGLCDQVNIAGEKDAVGNFIEKSRSDAYEALDRAHEIIGDTPIAIDYTAFPYIIELAELLTKHGFNVTRLYSDGFPVDEKEAFERLKKSKPDIMVYPTNEPAMRFAARENHEERIDTAATDMTDEKILAIGQKAAYFTNTSYFVDIVEGGGMYGYKAIVKLAGLMTEAYHQSKDTKKIISHKGFGCESCL